MIEHPLSHIPNWGVARVFMDTKDGKLKKLALQSPYRNYRLNELTSTNRYHSLEDATKWLNTLRKNDPHGEYHLAFGFALEDRICVVDRDLKHFEDWKARMQAALDNSGGGYIRVSHSGKGVHEIGYLPNDVEVLRNRADDVTEVYCHGRYILVVENAAHRGEFKELCGGALATVHEANKRPSQLAAKRAVSKKQANLQPLQPVQLTDTQWAYARQVAQRSTFWDGTQHPNVHGRPDPSSGDYALFADIAQAVQFDPDAAMVIFKESGRYSPERIQKKNAGRSTDYFYYTATEAMFDIRERTPTLSLTVDWDRAAKDPTYTPEVAQIEQARAKASLDPLSHLKTINFKPMQEDSQPTQSVSKPTFLPSDVKLNLSLTPTAVPIQTEDKAYTQEKPSLNIALTKHVEKEGHAPAWPPLLDGTPNPSGTKVDTLEDLMLYLTPWENEPCSVQLAKMIGQELNQFSQEGLLILSYAHLASCVSGKAVYRALGESEYLRAALSVINIGDAGTGKTKVQIGVNHVFDRILGKDLPGQPNLLRPRTEEDSGSSGAGVYNVMKRVDSSKRSCNWYIAEIGAWWKAAAGVLSNPHLEEAALSALRIVDATHYVSRPFTAKSAGNVDRPPLYNIYASIYGDMTVDDYLAGLDGNISTGMHSRLLFNQVSAKIKGFNCLSEDLTVRGRIEWMERLDALKHRSAELVRPVFINKAKGNLIPGERAYTTESPLVIIMDSPPSEGDHNTVGARLQKLHSGDTRHTALARGAQHIASMALVDAIYNPYIEDGCCFVPTRYFDFASDLILRLADSTMQLTSLTGSKHGLTRAETLVIKQFFKMVDGKAPTAIRESPGYAALCEQKMVSVSVLAMGLHERAEFKAKGPFGSVGKDHVLHVIKRLAEAGDYFTELSRDEVNKMNAQSRGRKFTRLFALNIGHPPVPE